MISLENVSKKFGKNIVFENLNLQFKPGSISGIVGENGAGKTTLFRCIAGLESYEGRIDSLKSPLKNHLGYLMTNPYLLDRITGMEYIELFLYAREISIKNIAQHNIFDLPLKEYATNYSTGMKKKLAITAMLLLNNDYFILDEPFSGLDIQSNMLLTEIIQKLRSLNKTILLSSHIFVGLEQICDVIHLLQKGKPLQTVLPPQYASLKETMMQSVRRTKIDTLPLKFSDS